MFRLLFVVAVAAAAPLEDTAEVAAAKEEFLAAFQAAFDDAAAGGLAAKQAPAPVHVLPEPTAVVAAAPAFGYYPAPAAAYNYGYLNYPYAAPYNLAAFSQYPYTGLVY